jgi:mono/diheme cytochrome c family protein
MNCQTLRMRSIPALLCATLTLALLPPAFAEDLSALTGPQLYRQYCGSCHGRAGEGNGPVAPFFKLLPPDLTEIARRSGGTYPAERVRRIIDGREMLTPHGAREMPVWGFAFAMAADDAAVGRAMADTAIARLVEYLRSIQKPPRPQR